MFQERKLPSKERQAEALAFLQALDPSKAYRLQKIAAREDRPIAVYIGTAVEGKLSVMKAKEFARFGDQYSLNDFAVHIQGGRINDTLRTSLIQGCGKTEDGVILIETLNSVYRLEVLA